MNYRSIFISDVHLGTKMSQADKLVDFLNKNDSEYLYLVGDIIDGWALQNNFYWPQEHNNVAQAILRKSRQGTKVIYIPGNHDEFLREYIEEKNITFGNMTLAHDCIHEGLNGRRYLVIHGDRFDAVIRKAKWLAHAGSHAYDFSILLTVWVNKIRKLFGLPHWSLAGALKYKVKQAVNFIGNYEKVLRGYAKSEKVDGIIAGHIHHPNMLFGDIDYFNCGDWVEHTTAIVEHNFDGAWELIKYENSNSD